MSPVWVTILMFFFMFFGMVWGFDLAFLLGTIGVIFAIFLWGVHSLPSIINLIYMYMTMYSLVCIPLFVFMAYVLERAGIGDGLFTMMYRWMGHVKGGLAMGTVAICTLMAAMTSGAALAVATMGILALPNMLKRGYDKDMVCGAIMSGAGLGSLIPPSVMFILYAVFSGESAGQLFMGGVFPGLMFAAMYMGYIGIRCYLNPSLGPTLPSDESFTWREKFASMKSVILPILIVILMLGALFTGMATATESAAVGAVGSIVCAAVNRKLTWRVIKDSSVRTFAVTLMVQWIIYGAAVFALIYQSLGATKFISGIISGLEVNRWIILIIIQVSFFLLGCVLNNMAILMLTLPVYLPVIRALGFDPLWFGILYVVNMEMGLVTPPFGFTLFYMKAVCPPEISMTDLYRCIWPFVALMAVGLILCMLFPQICLWLPSKMIHAIG